MGQTVDEVFAIAAKAHGERTHLIETDGTRISYAQIFHDAKRFAAVLIEAGIAPGDRVACFIQNSPTLYQFFIGCARAGAIAVPMNVLNTARENEALFADCAPGALVADAALLPALPDRILPDALELRLVAGPAGAAANSWRSYEDALAGAEPGPPDSRSRPDTAAMISYSSGTTGRPKGIVLGHSQLLVNARLVVEALGYRPDDRFLTVLPSFHLFGYAFDFLYCGLVGGTMVVMRAFHPEAALELIERERVTVLAGVPTMFVAMFDPATLGDLDVSSLRLIDVGGGPVPVSLVRTLKDKIGIDTVESYGLTEISPVASVQLPGQPAPDGSCGPVLNGIEVRVVDGDGEDVRIGEPGELLFRSDTFMLGYWNQPELTQETLRGGWLHTGDVGRLDEDGNIFILDRIKDMIVTNGYNVFPKEVETVLFSHPAVQAAAVVGVPHKVRGEDVIAYVIGAPGQSAATNELIEHCRQNLARFKVPRAVTFVDELPLTVSGKIRRFRLREMQGQGGGQSKGASDDDC
jgi:long-chain acyl-CoA synthetase